jgi:O-antigen/teichoic acid export membrane protein
MMEHLPKRKLLTNTFYNLLGKVFPLLIGIISIPILIHKMGTDRFGILTIAWMLIGYFGIFDLGVGRATTKYVAEFLALDQEEELASLVWTSIFTLFWFGLLGSLTLAFLTPWLVGSIFKIPLELKVESRQAFYVIAGCLPFALSATGMRGVLEAQQRFGLINLIRVPTLVANYLAPLLVVTFTTNLAFIVGLLAGSRLVLWLAYLYFCLNSVPHMRRPRWPHLQNLKKLLSFGGWMTISQIIYPIMMSMDRFFIGAILSMEAVAYYVTPYEIVSKLTVIPNSLVPVLFPAMAAYAVTQEDKIAVLTVRAIKALVLILTPIVVCMIILAGPFLEHWIGREFAQASTVVFQLLTVGVLLAIVGDTLESTLQAMGRPDLTAKFHFLELPVFLVMIWVSIHALGLFGIALAWVLRQLINTALMFMGALRLMPGRPGIRLLAQTRFVSGLAVLLVVIFSLARVPNLAIKLISLPIILVALVTFFWRYVLDEEEKEFLFSAKRKLLGLAVETGNGRLSD